MSRKRPHFLNARGGVLLAGVGEDGRLIGVKGAEEKAPSVQQRLHAAISPPASLSVTVQDREGKKLIVIDVPRGLEKPYVCNGRIMVRRGTAVVPAGVDEISSLIGQRARSEGRWERLPALGVEEDDLDADLISRVAETIKERRGYDLGSAGGPKKALERRRPQPPKVKPSPFRQAPHLTEMLDRLGLVQAGQFTNAALVLFGTNPAEWYPQTRVRAAHFRGDKRTDFLDNKVFEGSLFSLVETLLSFVKTHIPVASSLAPDDLQRRDRIAYPLAAVREALVNALVHRDYSAFDGGLSVAVYEGRIEFWNSGSLPDDMTVADLRTTHPSPSDQPGRRPGLFPVRADGALGDRDTENHPRLRGQRPARTRMEGGQERGDADPAALGDGAGAHGDQPSESSPIGRRPRGCVRARS